MSTNSECLFIEIKPKQWYYILEDYHAPQNSDNWMEYASAYGPFDSEDTALDHLGKNHANPGGFGTSPLREGQTEVDLTKRPVLKNLIENAIFPRSRTSGASWNHGRFR